MAAATCSPCAGQAGQLEWKPVGAARGLRNGWQEDLAGDRATDRLQQVGSRRVGAGGGQKAADSLSSLRLRNNSKLANSAFDVDDGGGDDDDKADNTR